ncbi:waprin-like protein [Musca domestica]|uniref:Waprin-like protein n=1 Tax=Musca domestica TaxID=7370 RepID=A0A9J7IAQ7_MUSDO|nr:waprin-like protein [Musca domestica]
MAFQCQNCIFLVLVFTCVMAQIISAQSNECPPSSKVYTCSPRCYKDGDCATMGGKCCPDTCNQKSCVPRHMLNKYGDAGNTRPDKYGPNKGTVYCGNVKCTAFERCEVDRTTKRERCVRA